MIGKFRIRLVSGFVGDVAGVATEGERSVAATPGGSIDARVVAAETEIVLLICAGRGSQKAMLVIRKVRVVTFQAIAIGAGMHVILSALGGVALQTKTQGRCRKKLYPCNVFRHPYLVATQAA